MSRPSTKPSDSDSPSKTALKREMIGRQKLGEELIELTPSQLEQLDLPVELVDAIQAAQKMTKHRALYRQRQYIGKIMRHVDVDSISAALDALRHPERLAKARFHQVEAWRDRLLTEPDAATEFITLFTGVDRQQFGQKLRAARAEHQGGKPAGAGRALFRFIDQLVAQQLNGKSD